MKLAELPRLLRTVRHLRWSQVARRIERNAQRRLRRLSPADVRVTMADCAARDQFPVIPLPHRIGTGGEAKVELLRDGRFSHLHQTEALGREMPDWRLGTQRSGRLWSITLHYHAWAYELAEVVRGGGPLAAEAAEYLEHYVGDWLRRCDLSVPGAEELAWNPYAIATRLSWWIRTYHALGRGFWEQRSPFARAFLSSLWRQARHLAANLEWDLRANHLLRDAVGLAWAGRFFQGEEPQRWLRTATRLAVEQVREQVLPDGGHFERSPHYHAEIMHDCLSLAMLLQHDEVVAELRRVWAAMAEYLAWLRHPSGVSPEFNDSARCLPNETLELGKHLSLRVDTAPRRGGRHFADSGVVAWHGSPWSVFFDVGEIGPDYQPGHAHADTLTLEFSLADKRLFVDPGCHSYDLDERRRYDRSTAAHNTVCIDGVDSSEVWHIFRVGRRARPFVMETEFAANRMQVGATHNGYDHLPGAPRHTRTVTAENDGELCIVDLVDGRGRHDVSGGFLLAPEWRAEAVADGWLVTNGATQARVHCEADREVDLSIQTRPLHPDYGLEQETNRLCWTYRGELPLRVAVRVEDRAQNLKSQI